MAQRALHPKGNPRTFEVKVSAIAGDTVMVECTDYHQHLGTQMGTVSSIELGFREDGSYHIRYFVTLGMKGPDNEYIRLSAYDPKIYRI